MNTFSLNSKILLKLLEKLNFYNTVKLNQVFKNIIP